MVGQTRTIIIPSPPYDTHCLIFTFSFVCIVFVLVANVQVVTQAGWTASKEWKEGESVTGECSAGYITAGRWRGGGRGQGLDACNAGFTDTCEQIGRFRSFYDGPVCEPLSCPVPTGPGFIVSATAGGGVGAALAFGVCVDVSCQEGYQVSFPISLRNQV
jgi:hypothetical protein